ncbi:hypothetical protein BO86DRAFT_351321 [Aspergillus japonicus CBS 114.51]|uniref:Uncharacterized protein n=1 Tax=Aspergillus japonicus CBS 114.51 TaxID=1448312 RepID=A0A8T8XIX2_ASPJA|nr:hypothetical protein BO86DRAFT_351321 [Aspergillus japonicus CBS 114.51]RAH87502.1 hypothetical protein BO86DRAFT_351321 [Aspergillus japonicus CBS 114.51]
MSSIQLDNTGNGQLQVPGFHDIPVDYELPSDRCFAHGALPNWTGSRGRATRLTQPEVLMLRIMEMLTERQNWEIDVFDESIAQKWYEEMLIQSQAQSGQEEEKAGNMSVDMDLVTSKTWNWCISELRDKAVTYRENGYILTFNADSGVCKSAVLVNESLQRELQEAFQPLMGECVDHKKSGQHDLVDPDMYMLVYGRTAVLSQGGQVTMTAADLSYPTTSSNVHVAPMPQHPIDTWTRQHGHPPHDDRLRSLYRWSHQFQWLPCDVEFVGSEGTDVRITSYINNLHPRNKKAYGAIEKLISACLEPWNDVLIKEPVSRFPLRIRTYGFQKTRLNAQYDRIKSENWDWHRPDRHWPGQTWAMHCAKIKQYLAIPEPDPKYRIIDDDPSDPVYPEDLLSSMAPEMWESVERVVKVVQEKWVRLHTFQYPEPGISYSYDEWKLGRTAKPIVDIRKASREVFEDPPPSPPDHQYQSVSLQNQFRSQGLQVIVRVSSIELNAESPNFPGDDDYHVDGLLNEHVVATARYYYDVENITGARISFQQEVDLDAFEITLEPHAMQKIFGLPRTDEDPANYGGPPPKLQTLGSVTATRQGCFLAWPNTLRYRTLPFSLQNSDLPGHQRFITIWLVDPHYRICSSRNVPAQQHTWWREDAEFDHLSNHFRLPQELRDLIMRKTGDWPMGFDEAARFKKQSALERERAICAQSQGVDLHDFWWPIQLGEQS